MLDVSRSAIRLLIPMTRPSMSNSGPPESPPTSDMRRGEHIAVLANDNAASPSGADLHADRALLQLIGEVSHMALHRPQIGYARRGGALQHGPQTLRNRAGSRGCRRRCGSVGCIAAHG